MSEAKGVPRSVSPVSLASCSPSQAVPSQLSCPAAPHAPLSGFKAGAPERSSERASYLGAAALGVSRELATRAWERSERDSWLLGTSRDADPALAGAEQL